MGNPGQDARLLGLVLPESDAGWFMTVRYEDSGHIQHDDAKDWNGDDLLKSYREGTEAANEERVKLGAPAGEPQGVNDNTYVLGREGCFMLNLVTGLSELPQHKPAAKLFKRSRGQPATPGG